MWLRLHLTLDASREEELHTFLLGWGAQSVSLANAGLDTDADSQTANPSEPGWERLQLTALFDAASDRNGLRSALMARGFADPQFDFLAERDWLREWMRHCQPMRFGERLWVCPTPTTPPPDARVVLRIDPGHAFGSGTHESTALCLRWLDAHALDGLRVLDYGCGSGILAIAALRLGAARASAVDIDPLSLDATRANARSNHVLDRLAIGYVEDVGAQRFDLVLANIVWGTLLTLAPRLVAHTRPGGRLLLSGVLSRQAATLCERYSPWFDMQEAGRDQDWVLLAGERRV